MRRRSPRVADPLPSLPSEILVAIANRLENQADVCRFRAVCKKWQLSVPKPPNKKLLHPDLPLQIPKAECPPFSPVRCKAFDVVATAIFLVKPLSPKKLSHSQYPWILRVQEREPAGKLHPLEPLSGKSLLQVPPLPESFPKFLDLSEYQLSQIGMSCEFWSSRRPLACGRVLLCSTSPVDNFILVSQHSVGLYVSMSLSSMKWDRSSNRFFRDIIWFKGNVYAVSEVGSLYVIDHKTLSVAETVVERSLEFWQYRWFELVGSSDDLFMVVSRHGLSDSIKVYKLNKMQRKWDKVDTLGDRTIFLGSDFCFILSTQDVIGRKGDFVVANWGRKTHREMATDLRVYTWASADGLTKISQQDQAFSRFSQVLGLPPTWFIENPFNFSRRKSENDEAHKDICEQQSPAGHREEPLPSSLQHVDQGQTAHSKVPLASASKNQYDPDFLVISDKRKEHSIDSETETGVEMVTGATIQGSNNNASTTEFEGVHIRSDLVPTLHKVWRKYGNVVEGIALRSKSMKAGALELLANLIIMLQNLSGRTLTKSQCDDINSTMSDLLQLQLRVEWLVPYVEKAVAFNGSKLLIDYHTELGKNIARAKEMKVKLVGELATLDKLEREWEEERDAVLKKIPVVEPVDLE